MRKYIFRVSFHRPDGLATIWIIANRSFSSYEAEAKMIRAFTELITFCPKLIVGMNLGISGRNLGDTIEVSKLEWQIEVCCPKNFVKQVLNKLQKMWKGEWKEDKIVWEKVIP